MPVPSTLFSISRFVLPAFFTSILAAGAETQWIALFNGRDLSGWDTYIGPLYSEDKGEFDGAPIGLNHDPRGVFKVVEEDGAPAIRVSGIEWGGFSTVDEYENYHLRFQFKWGEGRFPPRAESRRDSGLLYHAVGPHAADWFFWMRSQEFQIQEGDCGDFWALAGCSVTVRAILEGEGDDARHVYNAAGDPIRFQVDEPAGRHVKKFPDAENPTGEWNTLDLYCLGGTSIHVVNGVVTMVLHDSQQPDGRGGMTPLTKGKLQFQSEGAEVFYRDLKIRPIDRLPTTTIR